MRAFGPLLLLLPLVACGDVNHTATDYTQSSKRLATAGNDEVPRFAPVVVGAVPTVSASAPPAPPRSFGVSLSPLSVSTLRGAGRLTSSGSSTVVLLGLLGGRSHTTYEGAVRRGSCTAIGSMVTGLVPVTVDSAGTGRSASWIDTPIDRLLSAPHVLVFGPGGRPESCGPLSAATPPPPPGATGELDTVPRDRIPAPSTAPPGS